jgi:hypothetical protein
MKFFCELYDSSYNYVKGCSFVMRYLNELILKSGVKCVLLLLAISIDSDHMFFFIYYYYFFYACRYISQVGLEESGGYS